MARDPNRKRGLNALKTFLLVCNWTFVVVFHNERTNLLHLFNKLNLFILKNCQPFYFSPLSIKMDKQIKCWFTHFLNGLQAFPQMLLLPEGGLFWFLYAKPPKNILNVYQKLKLTLFQFIFFTVFLSVDKHYLFNHFELFDSSLETTWLFYGQTITAHCFLTKRKGTEEGFELFWVDAGRLWGWVRFLFGTGKVDEINLLNWIVAANGQIVTFGRARED